MLKSPDAPDKESDGVADGLDVNSLLNGMDVHSEERTDWLTADEDDTSYRKFSEDEIVSIAREENAEEEDDEEEIAAPTVSHADTCQELQTVLTYLDQQPSAPKDTIVILNGLLLQTTKKRIMNFKDRQKLMTTFPYCNWNSYNTLVCISCVYNTRVSVMSCSAYVSVSF